VFQVAVAVAGLLLSGVGVLTLRRLRRFIAGRQSMSATVTATTAADLLLRLPTGETATVRVGPQAASRWRQQLAHGPGPFEEPDLQDPSGWDEVQVSYAPNATPQVVLTQTLDDARTKPTVLVTLGLLTATSALLALSVPVLLGVLSLISAAVAVMLGFGLIRTNRTVSSVVLAAAVVVFLGGAAIAMVVAALTWG
jgi:hypothetical protein